MNLEIAEKWIAALESGEYPQTTSKLERNGSFCCLGVLCKIAPADVVTRREVKNSCDVTDCSSCEMVTYDGADGFIPASVRDWAGMSSTNGTLPATNEWGDKLSLVFYNDSEGYSFQQIANLIRENVDAL